MSKFSIPSKWTKDDFAWAAYCTRFEHVFEKSDVLADVTDCLMYGFSCFKRNFSTRVDWSLMQSEVDKRRSGYYLNESILNK